MVSTRPFISKSSCPFINPLVIVPRAPITISINVTFMFHSFFSTLARSRYLSLFLFSFNFTLWSARTVKSTILQVLFFLLIIIRSSCLVEIKWSVWMSKSQSIIIIIIIIINMLIMCVSLISLTELWKQRLDIARIWHAPFVYFETLYSILRFQPIVLNK